MGENPGFFGLFLKLIPPALTKSFREEVLRDPASSRCFREGVRLWKEGIRIPPNFVDDEASTERDPRILADALDLIKRAGPHDLSLLQGFTESPFPVIQQGAREKLKRLGGK